ncbi:MAG: tetratricopeptide repeat protein [Deltaproteobacteria bacterium]|nr:tetratricopeptide repeat protein [Deltaproteobacteria bacterium]
MIVAQASRAPARALLLRVLVPLVLALLVGAGCAYQKAMDRGEAAMRAGDYDRAVHHFTRATRLDPEEDEAHQRLAEAKAAAVGVRLAGARDALARGALIDAARVTGEALRLLPDDPQAAALGQDVLAAVEARGRQHLALREHALARTLYADTMALLGDSQGRIVSADQAAVAAWIAWLTEGRDRATKAGRIGDALLQQRQIVELAPSAVERARCTQLATQLRERHEVVLEQRQLVDDDRHRRGGHRPGKGGAERRFTELAQSLAQVGAAQWLRVLGPDAPASARAAGIIAHTMREPRVDARHDLEVRTAEYQSGTRPVPNPARLARERDVHDAERRVLEAEQEVTRRERDVEQARAEVDREGPPPDRETYAERRLEDARDALDRARQSLLAERDNLRSWREDLARIPPFVPEPVFSTHSFEVKKVAVRAESSLTAVVDWPGQDGAPATTPLLVEAFDEGWADQPIIGLPADPIALPSERELVDAVMSAARAELDRLVQVAFAQAVSAQRARAMALDGDARMDALVAYLLMDPAVVDPEADALVWEVRGIPNAAALLDTCGSF